MHPGSRHYTYRPPMSPLPAQVGAGLGGRGWEMTARIDRTGGGQGVLFATGTENAGVSWFVQGDRLVLDYNSFGDHHVVESDLALPEGPTEVGVRFVRDGQEGDLTLVVEGEECGSVHLPYAMRIMSSVGPSVGYDAGSPVSDRYEAPFAFTGRLEQVDVQLAGGHSQAEAETRLATEMGRQ